MKNQFPIILFSLLGLCILACTLLIIVILRTGIPFMALHFKSEKITESTSPGESLPSYNDFHLPDNQQEPQQEPQPLENSADDTLHTDTVETAVTDSDAAETVRYYSMFPCHKRIRGKDLKMLFSDNNIFCQTSPWSDLWANPRGTGLRDATEGLLFTDSTVVDTLTDIVWQRYPSQERFTFDKTQEYIDYINSIKWQGYNNWRLPKIEEIMVTLLPYKNSSGLYLPEGWDYRATDIWSCNWATDSLDTRWRWVARTALGRCNVGHPDTARYCMAVHRL